MTYKILSLAGGGARGIFQAKFLAEIDNLLGPKKNIADCFDLITGTSTGAIIGLALALKVSTKDILKFYKDHGGKIFPEAKRKWGECKASYFGAGPLYDQSPLKKALEEVLQESTLGDCSPSILIPATNLDQFKYRIFSNIKSNFNSSSQHEREKYPDDDLLAVDVALASAAAPLYFPATGLRYINNGRITKNDAEARSYVDGGLWANNPALVAAMVAHRDLGVPFEDMRIVSIGNGIHPGGKSQINFNKILRLQMLKPLLDMMFAAQAEMADDFLRHLIRDSGGKKYLEINTPLGERIDLDNMKEARKLLAHAESTASTNIDRFREVINEPVLDYAGTTRCPLPKISLKRQHVRDESMDRSNLYYAYIAIDPIDKLRRVRHALEHWDNTLDPKDAPSEILVTGVFDVYGAVDIVVRLRGGNNDTDKTIREKILAQLKAKVPALTKIDIEILDVYVELFQASDSSNDSVIDRPDESVRSMRTFVDIQLPVPSIEHANSVLERLQTVLSEKKERRAHLLAVNWGRRFGKSGKNDNRWIVAEFYISCGGYYDFGELLREIEEHVEPHAKSKQTLLTFSSWTLHGKRVSTDDRI